MNKRCVFMLAILLAPFCVMATPIQFEDVSESSGMSGHGETWGLSWGDINNDHRPDLFYQGHREFSRIYRNTGTGVFEDVAYEYDPNGLWMNDIFNDMHGSTFADVDNDGDDDVLIAVSASGSGQLLMNQNGSRFVDFALSAGLASDATARHAVWFDYNNDGLLDVLQHHSGGSTLRRRNASSFTFTNVGNFCTGHGDYGQLADMNNDDVLDYICGRQGAFPQAMYSYASGSFAAITSIFPTASNVIDSIPGDFNNDLKTDMVLVRGTLRPAGASKTGPNGIEAWFRGGNPGFTFSAVGEVTFTADYEGIGPNSAPTVRVLNTNGTSSANLANEISVSYNSGTGLWRVTFIGTRQAYVQVAAQNTVSDPVMFGTSSQEQPIEVMHAVNTNAGISYVFNTGLFTPVSCASGVAADFDNDMDLDLYLACRKGAENLSNRYFDNQGNGTFIEVPSHGGEGLVGAGLKFGTSDSVATADYNMDGFMDLAVSNGLQFYPYGVGGMDTLIKNKGNGNHWIEIDLEGTISNRDGIGAKIYATAGGVTQMREQNNGTHRWSQNHQRIHFGLASNTTVNITVKWPSGRVDQYNNITADKLYNAKENGNMTPVILGAPVVITLNSGNECGQPNYNIEYGPAVLIWRDCSSNNWHVRMKGGRESNNRLVTAGSIVADTAFTGFSGFQLGGSDSVTQSTPETIDFSVGVWFTNDRGFNFNTGSQGISCMVLDTRDIDSVIVGSSRKRLSVASLDLISLGECAHDFDGDGLDDDVDPDDDNDGVLDVDDAFPFDPAESLIVIMTG